MDNLIEIRVNHLEKLRDSSEIGSVHQSLSSMLNRVVSFDEGEGEQSLPIFSGLKVLHDSKEVFILLRQGLTTDEQGQLEEYWRSLDQE